MPANIDSMAYYGEVPWHGLGTKIPERATVTEMIKAAGLDWGVEKRPARGASINKEGIASRYEIVRLPRNDETDEILLGVVSERYEPLQNHEAFDFFDPVVGENKSCFETAGSLGQGERIWALAKMPDVMTIVPGDECKKYLLLSNRHDGKGSVIVKFTLVRVVCENTLMLAMKDGQKAYHVRHSKIMTVRLNEVAEILSAAKEIYEHSEMLFKQMAEKHLKSDQFINYLDIVFPRTKDQKKSNKTPKRLNYIQEIFESSPTIQMKGVKGTLWGAYNAITQFEDYKTLNKDEEKDERLNRTWFGAGANTKLKALIAAQQIISPP